MPVSDTTASRSERSIRWRCVSGGESEKAVVAHAVKVCDVPLAGHEAEQALEGVLAAAGMPVIKEAGRCAGRRP